MPRVEEVSRLGRYAAAWDRLVEPAPLPTPFLRSWWVDGLADDRTHLLLVLDGDELLGGLALERARSLPGVPRYRVAGGGPLSPDHLDLVAAPGRSDDVVRALAGWFVAGPKVLDLRGLRDGATVLDALPDARIEDEEVAPYEPLGALADYVAARSRGFERRMRRRSRQVEGRGVAVRLLGPDEIGAGVASLAGLHEALGGRHALVAELPRLGAALPAAARRGEVRMYVAERGPGSVVGGVQLCLVVAGRLSLYQLARRVSPEFDDVGTALIWRAIEDAAADGVTEVDFLRGDEEYKASFAGHRRRLLRARAAHGPLPRLVLAAELAARGAVRQVRRRLRRG